MKRDPGFQEALAKRGVTDFEAVQVDAWPAGNFGAPGGAGPAARPLPGLRPPAPRRQRVGAPGRRADRARRPDDARGVRIDDHGVVPIPRGVRELRRGGGDRRRPPAARRHPPARDQPAGGTELRPRRARVCGGRTGSSASASPRARVWSSTRSPTTTSDARRPILYRASLSEMVVPYGDPSPTHFFKNAFDAGENGVGIARHSLTLGCDCLGEIRYLDAALADGDGEPVDDPERDLHPRGGHRGALEAHRLAHRRGRGPPRPPAGDLLVLDDRQLRLRLLLVLLHQDGSISYEVKLTGSALDRRRAPGEQPRHGVLVAPGLNAMVHQHFFNVRLDLDVDGARQLGRTRSTTESTPAGPENPTATRSRSGAKPLRTEAEARRRSIRRRRAGGRSSTRTSATGSAHPSATGCAGRERAARSPTPTPP